MISVENNSVTYNSLLYKLTNTFVFLQLGLLVSYVMLFGNEMLLTSFYASCILAVSVSTLVYITIISSTQLLPPS